MNTISNFQTAITKNPKVAEMLSRLNLQYVDEESGKVVDKTNIENYLTNNKTKIEKQMKALTKEELVNFEEQNLPKKNGDESLDRIIVDMTKEIDFNGIFLGIEEIPMEKDPFKVLVFEHEKKNYTIKAWKLLLNYFESAEKGKLYYLHYDGKKTPDGGGFPYHDVKIFKSKI